MGRNECDKCGIHIVYCECPAPPAHKRVQAMGSCVICGAFACTHNPNTPDAYCRGCHRLKEHCKCSTAALPTFPA